MNSIKDIAIKNCAYYCFDDINIKIRDPNKININEKLCKNFFINHIGYVRVKNLSYVKINSVNPLYLMTDKINRYVEESNGNRYLMLVPINESNKILKKYEESWSKIRGLVKSINSYSDDYDQKYSDDNLPLNFLYLF